MNNRFWLGFGMWYVVRLQQLYMVEVQSGKLCGYRKGLSTSKALGNFSHTILVI
jgi:hypothetical protein